MSKNKECQIINNKVFPCDSLSRHDDNKIIRCREVEDHGDISKIFYTLHEKISGKKGVIINFCPFCGEDINSHIISCT